MWRFPYDYKVCYFFNKRSRKSNSEGFEPWTIASDRDIANSLHNRTGQLGNLTTDYHARLGAMVLGSDLIVYFKSSRICTNIEIGGVNNFSLKSIHMLINSASS